MATMEHFFEAQDFRRGPGRGATDWPAGDLDFDDPLRPAAAFRHPDEVVEDADLTLEEKRAILASWASDARALEAAPLFRRAPGGETVRFDDIVKALRRLDRRQRAASARRADFFRRAPLIEAQGSRSPAP